MKTMYFWSKAGRNDPCPCGSGMKFKKCCLFKPFQPSPELLADFELGQKLLVEYESTLDKSKLTETKKPMRNNSKLVGLVGASIILSGLNFKP